MFLAINEIKHSKLRYALVTGVVFLIAYLVFFLIGLSYGLAQDNRTAVDKWSADSIVLSKDSNNNMNMSKFSKSDFNDIKANKKAYLASTSVVIKDKDKINSIIFGINKKQFIMPNVIQGKSFKNKNEVISDSSFKKQYGIKLNQKLKISGIKQRLKVVGFTDNAKFNVSPVLYTNYKTYKDISSIKAAPNMPDQINAVIARGKVKSVAKGTKDMTIKNFIKELPGYEPQVLTFGFMIGFLIVIAAIVIGIFVYVLTMQKKEIFGVMKAQGVSSKYISNSVIIQTAILSTAGVLLGVVLTLISSLILPSAVPFQINATFFIVISIIMILVATIGALFSVRTIVKIDPLKAIG